MRPLASIPILFLLAPLALGQDDSRRTEPFSEQELSDMEERGKFHFTVCDSDTNGWISFREAHASLGIDKEEYRTFDSSGDGRLSSREFRRRYPRMLELFRKQAAEQADETPGPPTEPESALPIDSSRSLRRNALPPMDPSQPTFPFPTPEDLLAAFDRDASNGLSRGETANALAATGSQLSIEVLFDRTNRDETEELELEELGPLSFFIARRIPERLVRTEEMVADTTADLVPTVTTALGNEPELLADPSAPFAADPSAPFAADPIETPSVATKEAPPAETLTLETAAIDPATSAPLRTEPEALETVPLEPEPSAATVALAVEPEALPETSPETIELPIDDVPRRRIGDPVDPPVELETVASSVPSSKKRDELPEIPARTPNERSARETFQSLAPTPEIALPIPGDPAPPVRGKRKRMGKHERALPTDRGEAWTPGHFRRLDADGDGAIEPADLERLLAPARSAVRIRAVIAALDGDGDGRLNPAELVRSLGKR
jgi:Ca2+-binding EF-hand superfamily protein